MSSLDLRIPPDVVWLVVAAMQWLASRVTPTLDVATPWRIVIALVLAAAGAVLIVAGRVALNRAGTTWHPTEPARATALVTSGVYRFSRNPMYLGMELVLLGLAALLASPAAALVSALFVAYIDRFQIRPEERTLAGALGQDYDDYRRDVRRWV